MEFKYRNPKIFVFCGGARSGKDTAATLLRKISEENGKKVLNLQFSKTIKEYAKTVSDWDGSDETKPRELLQQLGTELIRFQIDERLFVNRMIEDIKVYSYFFDVITISDTRIRLEVDTIKEQFSNVVIIKVERPNVESGLTSAQKKHLTEVGLYDYDTYDYKIINDSTKENLELKINELLEEVY